MNRKKFAITILLLSFCIVVLASIFVYSKRTVPTQETAQLISNEEKQSYISYGTKALDSVNPNMSIDEKYNIKFDAIYQAIFRDKAELLIKDIAVSDIEINNYLVDVNNRNLSKILILSKDNLEWSYNLYNDSPEINSLKEGDKWLDYDIKRIEDATMEAKRDYAEKSLKSQRLVNKISQITKEILE